MAAFGALLTVLSLAVDPFSQASVSTQNCITQQYSPSIIPRAVNFSDYVTTQPPAYVNYPSPALQAALDIGIIQSPASGLAGIPSMANCPSANCTLTLQPGGAFTTLTMCHTCLDVTTELHSTFNDSVGDSGYPDPRTTYVYNHTTSNREFNISTRATVHDKIGWGGPSHKVYYVALNITSAPGSQLKQATRLIPDGPWQDTSIAGFQGIFTLPKNLTSAQAEPLTYEAGYKPIAVDCALRPCVKAYKADVSRGVYRETEVDRWYLHWDWLRPSTELW